MSKLYRVENRFSLYAKTYKIGQVIEADQFSEEVIDTLHRNKYIVPTTKKIETTMIEPTTTTSRTKNEDEDGNDERHSKAKE
jgi:hypothetical protein